MVKKCAIILLYVKITARIFRLMPSKTENLAMTDGFSPLLVAGMMIRPLPVAPLNHLLRHISQKIQNNHPAILERLRPLAGTHFLICPTDLPHNMRLIIGELHVDCMIEDEFLGPVDVTIRGPFLSLMDMMDGRVDGDALFFSRRLTVEGDTEALLILRNAMDSDDIDLRAEILNSFGPLKTPASAVLKIGERLFQNLSRDMSHFSQAMTKPLSNRCEGLELENQGLNEKINHLEKMLTKTQNRLQSLSRKIKT